MREQHLVQSNLAYGLPHWRLSLQDFVTNYVVNLVATDSSSVRVLDLGCGIGYMLAKLSRSLPRNARLFGIDTNKIAISRAEELVEKVGGKAKTEFRCWNAEDMAFDDEGFNIIVANLSFSVFRRPGKAAAEVFRILKPSGRLIVSEVSSVSLLGNFGRLFDAASGHLYYHLFSPYSLADLFASCGLRTIRFARVPLKTKVLSHKVKIPVILSPVFLVELLKPSFLYQNKKDRYSY